jgi:hypothetical protein
MAPAVHIPANTRLAERALCCRTNDLAGVWIEAFGNESIRNRGIPVHHSIRIWAIAVHCLEQLQAWLAVAVGQILLLAP